MLIKPDNTEFRPDKHTRLRHQISDQTRFLKSDQILKPKKAQYKTDGLNKTEGLNQISMYLTRADEIERNQQRKWTKRTSESNSEVKNEQHSKIW